MFAGKTTRLLESISLAKRYKLNYVVIKPLIDTRYDEKEIKTHDQKSYVDNNIVILGKTPLPKKQKLKFVFIDEAQFLSIEEVQLIKQQYKTSEFIVFFGLYKDYADSPFPTSEYLIKNVDITEELLAKCSVCGADANKTQRLLANMPAPFGDVIQIGGENMYEARCSDCYVSPTEATYWFETHKVEV